MRVHRATWSLLGLCALVAAGLGTGSQPAAGAPPPGGPYNFVLVITDDQRWDTLWAMPIVQQKLIASGVEFVNAFVTTPSCCPSRSGFLTGYLAKNTGVVGNQVPNGGAALFPDANSLPLRLQQAGYKTHMVGKYLNEYSTISPYIPPGWTLFEGFVGGDILRFAVGSSTASSSVGQVETVPGGPPQREDSFKDKALDFIDQNVGSGPLFLYFNTINPHWRPQPAPGDENLFPDFVYRGRGYGETDLSDKPPWFVPAQWSGQVNSLEEEDEFHRDQLRSLQVVDRAVGAIHDRLAALGELDRTYFIFTSDHGYLWGEHGLFAKFQPYEEAIRVPLVVAGPGIAPRADASLVAANLDVPAMLLELAGLPVDGDGSSLLPLLQDPATPWREQLLLEHWEGVWAGFRTREASGAEWKYVERRDGVKELYDLVADPYELDSRHADPAYQSVVSSFEAQLAPLKGVGIPYRFNAPSGSFDVPYQFTVPVWGGQPPYSWDIAEGALPLGLTVDPMTGVVSGVPQEVVKSKEVRIRVTDSSVSRYTGGPLSYAAPLKFTAVGPCNDNQDNDGDGLRDYPEDLGCDSTTDTSERDPGMPCDDGIDNDGDGGIDYPGDPGCGHPGAPSESPACNDGLDNDGDGAVDWNGGPQGQPADPQCNVAWKAREDRVFCGLGLELTLLVPLLARLRSRRRSLRGRQVANT